VWFYRNVGIAKFIANHRASLSLEEGQVKKNVVLKISAHTQDLVTT
jgi:hypothetical protein